MTNERAKEDEAIESTITETANAIHAGNEYKLHCALNDLDDHLWVAGNLSAAAIDEMLAKVSLASRAGDKDLAMQRLKRTVRYLNPDSVVEQLAKEAGQ